MELAGGIRIQAAVDRVQPCGDRPQFGGQKILHCLPDVFGHARSLIVSLYNCGFSAKLFI
jgi:hypothetical protein